MVFYLSSHNRTAGQLECFPEELWSEKIIEECVSEAGVMYFMNFHSTHWTFMDPKSTCQQHALSHFFSVASSNCGRAWLQITWKQITSLLWQNLRKFRSYEMHLIPCQEDVMLFLINKIKKLVCYWHPLQTKIIT